MTFDQCIEHILDSEGRFTLNPNDKGNYTPSGELKGTKYGISARMYPKLDIKNLTLEQAKLIYFLIFIGPLVACGCPNPPNGVLFTPPAFNNDSNAGFDSLNSGPGVYTEPTDTPEF